MDPDRLGAGAHWLVLQGVPPGVGRLCCASRQGVHHPQRGCAAACGSGSPPITQPCRPLRLCGCAAARQTAQARQTRRQRPCALPPQNPPPHRVSPLTWPRREPVATEPTGNTEQGDGASASAAEAPAPEVSAAVAAAPAAAASAQSPSPVADGSGVDITHRAAPGQGTSTTAPPCACLRPSSWRLTWRASQKV